MSLSPAVHAAVEQGLRLRAWTLCVFAGAAGAAPPPEADAAAWERLLRTERCALPLRSRVAAAAIPLPAAALRVLEREAGLETKRFLSVCAQLRVVSRLLRARHLSAVALKGGVGAALGDAPVDVADLDLLLPTPEAALEVARALESEAGYYAVGQDPPLDSMAAHHLAARITDSALLVELHFAIPRLGDRAALWTGTKPTSVAAVQQLSPEVHAWHLLVHSVLQHPDRRGQVRELILLRRAIDACSPAQRGEVRRRMAQSSAARVLADVWDMAEGLDSGQAPADPLRPSAAVRLALAAGARPGPMAVRSLLALVHGGHEYARLWRDPRSGALHSPGFRGDTWLDRRAPRLAWAARVVARGAGLAAAYPAAARMHRALRSLVDAAE